MGDVPANEPKAEAYTGEEHRLIDPTREIFTLDQKAALIVANRFKGPDGKPQRPENLDEQKFKEDDAVRKIVARLFDRLEGKLDPEAIKKLAESFAQSIAIWEEAGLFTKERKAKGFSKPDFERDYQPLLDKEILRLTEEGEGLDKGYKTAVWAPMDVPIHNEDAENLSYSTLLKDALLKAYNGTAGGKAPNTLLVGPNKEVLTAEKIDIANILWQWDRYAKDGVMHNVETLDPENHGGVSETELLQGLTGVEKQTGGVLRLERDQLIMPKNLGKKIMSAQDWNAVEKKGKVLPSKVSSQDMKQALAHAIHCLNTQGWIPDFYDWNNPSGSRVALAPRTYVPDESSAGAVPALFWGVDFSQFNVGGRDAVRRVSRNGVRGGVRINN